MIQNQLVNYTKPISELPISELQNQVVNKPLSDCITSPKAIVPFHSSPKPTAERKTKRQQANQLHKINTKLLQRTYFALLLSDANQSFLPTSLNSSPGANCQISLFLTERYQSPKNGGRLQCIHRQINSSKHIKID